MSDVYAPQAVKTKPGDILAVSMATAPTTPVTGTFFQATQPVSLAVAPTTPVTGTFFQATQPVSIAVAPTTPVTGTFFQATQPVSMATAPTTPVTGTFFQATQPVSMGLAFVTGDSGHLTSAALAAGATVALDGLQIASGIGKLFEATVSSSVAIKAQLGTWDGTTFVVKRTFFVPANAPLLYEPSRYDAITMATGATAKFRWSITNNDNANAADVYASITQAI